MRGEIIWDKGASASASTAWGSWQSASNPTLRDTHEYILVFSKAVYRRNRPDARKDTIAKDEFLEYTKSVWAFPAQSASKVGHPAPFPVELPYRLIQLYSYAGEIVLDPFMGSGQTALAALKAGRRYVGYETNAAYVKRAQGADCRAGIIFLMDIKAQLTEAMRRAMKANDDVSRRTTRMALAAIKQVEVDKQTTLDDARGDGPAAEGNQESPGGD